MLGVREPSRDLNFPKEPIGAERRGHAGRSSGSPENRRESSKKSTP